MLGRRPTSDSTLDAAVVARRRLAVLAAQFEASRHRSSTEAMDDRGDRADRHDLMAPPDRHEAPDGPAGPGPPGTPDAPPSPREPRRRRSRARWQLSPQQVTVAALALVAALAVTGWWVLRSEPSPTPTPLAQLDTPVSASSEAPTLAAPAGATPVPPTATASLVVDVAGKVRHPGIVELPSGSRVVDAIDAAGGLRPRVDTTGLNLARLLVDGEQVVVGLTVPTVPSTGSISTPPSYPGSPSTTEPVSVNLNTATQLDLEALPGIGPVTAAAILQWRTDNGGFSSVDELLEVSGIGDVTLAELAPYVYV